jgi:hypothetical protein
MERKFCPKEPLEWERFVRVLIFFEATKLFVYSITQKTVHNNSAVAVLNILANLLKQCALVTFSLKT